MAGAMTAWAAEAWAARRSSASTFASVPTPAAGERSNARTFGGAVRSPDAWLAALADLSAPLTVACAVLAVIPDFDVFLHTHRTYSHSLGAAAVVWAIAALVAWRLRLPVLWTATVCAAAYASHIFLDWLGRDDSRLAGPMALWPLTTAHFKSGADLFMEFTLLHRRRFDLAAMLARNAHAVIREITILGGPFLLVMTLRLMVGGNKDSEASPLEGRRSDRLPALRRARAAPGERA